MRFKIIFFNLRTKLFYIINLSKYRLFIFGVYFVYYPVSKMSFHNNNVKNILDNGNKF